MSRITLRWSRSKRLYTPNTRRSATKWGAYSISQQLNEMFRIYFRCRNVRPFSVAAAVRFGESSVFFRVSLTIRTIENE